MTTPFSKRSASKPAGRPKFMGRPNVFLDQRWYAYFMPQLRQNIITGEWVVIAPERAKRPVEFISATEPRNQSSDGCVFCLDSDNYKGTRLKNYETDHIYVIPNKFPAFVEKPEYTQTRSYKVESDFFVAKPSVGGHDVVIIKDHFNRPGQFSSAIWRDLLVIFRRRYKHFKNLGNVQSTIAIYNHGSKAGASIVHPHAQIFAADILPNLISKELHETYNYFERNGASAFATVLEHEQKFHHRIIFENEHFVAYTQYAAKYPFEIWVLPKAQQSHFEDASDTELAALAVTMKKVLGKLDDSLKDPDFNFFIHSAPHNLGPLDYYRWHIEIAPRLSTFGGYELGSGIVIDVMSPEIAADYLNGKKDPNS